MSADTSTRREVIIACAPHAVPSEQRERWMIVGTQLYAAVQEVQELPDGYAFRLPTDLKCCSWWLKTSTWNGCVARSYVLRSKLSRMAGHVSYASRAGKGLKRFCG